jgi:hypothetical protein
MEKASTNGLMEESLLEVMHLIRKMDLANIFGQMAEYFKANGDKVKEMDQVEYCFQTGKFSKDFGKTISE